MSAVPFDPYHKWLGIPRSEQPAHHYRLLGIPVFEEDPQVIEGAADRQMAFLRKFQSGEHSADAMKLLNEISRARLCLLKPDTKAAYDETLKAQLGDGPSDIRGSGATPVWQQPLVLGGAGFGVVIVILLVFLLRPFSKPGTPNPEPGGKDKVAVVELPDEKSPVEPSKKKNAAGNQTDSAEPDDSQSTAGKKKTEPGRANSKTSKLPAPPAVHDGNSETDSTVVKWKFANGTQDLVAVINLDRDRIQGNWKVADGKLISPAGTKPAAVQWPVTPPDEFDLSADITRTSGEGTILLGFPVQGHQSGVAFDGWGGSTSGLETIDDEHPDTHPDKFTGKVLQPSQTVKVVCQIRKGSVTVEADGKRIVTWKGDPATLAVHSNYRLRKSPGVAVFVADAQFEIANLELTPRKSPSKTSKPPKSSSNPDAIDLLARIDVARDSPDSGWALEDGVLVGQTVGNESVGRLNLPYHPTPQYELSLTVERQLTRGSFAICLPVQGNQCAVILDTGNRNDTCGLSMIDGKLAHQNETTKRQKVLPGAEAITLVCRVERNHITLLSEGKVVLNWQGDASRLSAPDTISFIDPQGPMLCVIGSSGFKVTDVKISPLKDSGSPAVPPKVAATNGNSEGTAMEGSLQIEKLKTPDAAALEAARTTVRNSFKVEYGLAKKAEGKNLEPRISLAKSLFGKAQDTEDNPAACYVMLSEAAEFASEAGQLDLAWEILQSLGERFDTTPLPLMERAAKAAKPFAKTPEEIIVLSSMYAGLIEASILADDFETASKASQEATGVVRGKSTVVRDQLAAYGRRATLLREAFELATGARDKLQSTPDDGPANLAWGRYVCLYKGEWATGLPYLAKSSDAVLAALAKRDLDQPRDFEVLEQLGNDWWDLSEKEKEPVRSNLRSRAVDAWQTALPSASRQQATLLNLKIARQFEPTKSFVTTGSGQGVAVAGPEVNPGPLFTVEFWVSTTSSEGILISKRHQTRDSSVAISMSRGRPIIGGDSTDGFKSSRSKVAINDGRWHHVAAVKVGNRLGLFVDGKSVAQVVGYDGYQSGSPWKVGHQDIYRQSEIEAKFCRLRFSKDARYLLNFVPDKTYTKDKATYFVP